MKRWHKRSCIINDLTYVSLVTAISFCVYIYLYCISTPTIPSCQREDHHKYRIPSSKYRIPSSKSCHHRTNDCQNRSKPSAHFCQCFVCDRQLCERHKVSLLFFSIQVVLQAPILSHGLSIHSNSLNLITMRTRPQRQRDIYYDLVTSTATRHNTTTTTIPSMLAPIRMESGPSLIGMFFRNFNF